MKQLKNSQRAPWCAALPAAPVMLALALAATPAAALDLQEAVALAQRNDPWLQASAWREEAMSAQAVAAGALPDPTVEMGFANLPTDTFDFDQEAMTQFKVGVAQSFPRGDTRALSQRRLDVLAEQFPHQREERRARLAVDVTVTWLEAYRARRSISLIEQDRELFEQLVDVAQSSYASAMGRTRQQDLVRAQLEVTRLEDRLAVLHQRLETAQARLREWLWPSGDPGGWAAAGSISSTGPELPALQLRHPELFAEGEALAPRRLAPLLDQHPVIQGLDSKIEAGSVEVQLARQKYRPQWKVNASYGYREGNPHDGPDRPDFFSIGVGFDLPLFTSNLQDREVQSAIAGTEALRTDRTLALRALLAGFEAEYARLQRLDQRRALYQTRLLREMEAQAEASLSAYTSDDGDFAEVVRSRIAELNARIEALDIDTERLQTIARLNYFFAGSDPVAQGETS